MENNKNKIQKLWKSPFLTGSLKHFIGKFVTNGYSDTELAGTLDPSDWIEDTLLLACICNWAHTSKYKSLPPFQ